MEINLIDLPFIVGFAYLAITLWKKPWKTSPTWKSWLRNSAMVFAVLAGIRFISPDAIVFKYRYERIQVGPVELKVIMDNRLALSVFDNRVWTENEIPKKKGIRLDDLARQIEADNNRKTYSLEEAMNLKSVDDAK